MELNPGYRQTEAGVIPEDWEVKRFGELVSLGHSRIDPSRCEPQEFCVELEHIDQGSGSLIGWSATTHRSSLKTIFDSGDVLFGKLRAYLRKYWLANKEGVCSTEIWVFRPNEDVVTSEYLFQIVQMDWFIEAASTAYGTHMPRSDWKVVKRLELRVPPVPEQTVIATALSDTDALLESLDLLIAKKSNLKQAVMQQLLTGKTRLPGFEGELEKKLIGDLLAYERPDRYIVTSTSYSKQGDIPVLTANKAFILGYTNETFGICTDLPAIVFDDFTTDSKFATVPFKVKSSAIKLLRSKNERTSLRFLFEFMQIVRFPVGEHKRHYISDYQNIELQIPEHKEQLAIVSILSDMDAEIAALKHRCAKTKDLKQAMVQELLTGKTRLVTPGEINV